MNKRFSLRRLNSGYETLESRAMFAALAGVDVGASCAALVSTNSSLSSSSLSSGSLTAAAKGSAKPEYSYSFVGNRYDRAIDPVDGGLALMGGGAEVDAAFQWLANKANGGDFVVLSASSTTFYNKYISTLPLSPSSPKLDSVETLGIPTWAAAQTQFVYDTIANAEAIFIDGGDQANYINAWSNTLVEDALYAALRRNVPIGGTSAGLAVLGDIDFAATNGSISSADALADPLDPRITLNQDFLTTAGFKSDSTSLRLVDNVIMDSHFMQRDRMGRTMAFMARMDFDGLVTSAPRGIAVNEQTALLVEPDGSASVVGNGYSKKLSPEQQQRSVYMMEGIEAVIVPGESLDYQVHVQRLNYDPGSHVSDSFDLVSWTSDDVGAYDVLATDGVLSTGTGSIYG